MIRSKHGICEYCFDTLCGGEHTLCVRGEEKRPSIALACGCLLCKRYKIGKVLGVGGFGITYLAFDTESRKKVAVKEFFPSSVVTRDTKGNSVVLIDENKMPDLENGIDGFCREAEEIKRFYGNDGIIGVKELFKENNTAYYIMEYLNGCDLRHLVSVEHRTLPPGELMFLLEKVTDTLVLLHSGGLLHRDISPDNIFLCSDGKIKLIDFGSAREFITFKSLSLSVVLKPGFAPLEQYSKTGKQGPWTDIYALGATAYYALTGKIPPDAMSRADNDSVDFSMIKGNGLAEIISKMLKPDPKERYPSIPDLKNALSETDIRSIPIFSKASADAFSDGGPVTENITPTFTESPANKQIKKGQTGRMIGYFLIILFSVALIIVIMYFLPKLTIRDPSDTSIITSTPEEGSSDTHVPLSDFNEMSYNEANKYMNEGEYEKAVEIFSFLKDYSSSYEKKLDAMFLYVMSNKNNKDTTTYEYLKILVSEGYPDSENIFNTLYSWRLSGVCNTSADDFESSVDSVSYKSDYVHFYFTLNGGTPGSCLDLYYLLIWPDGKTERSMQVWENIGDGDSFSVYWNNGLFSEMASPVLGLLTVNIYVDGSNEFVGSLSVNINNK